MNLKYSTCPTQEEEEEKKKGGGNKKKQSVQWLPIVNYFS